MDLKGPSRRATRRCALVGITYTKRYVTSVQVLAYNTNDFHRRSKIWAFHLQKMR